MTLEQLNLDKSDWKKVKLGDIGQLIMGGTPSKKEQDYYGDDYVWITPSDIDRQRIYQDTSNTKLSTLGYSVARHIPANSLLITAIASIGKNCINTVDCSCNQQIIALVPKPEYDVLFLYYAISNIEDYLHGISGKTSVEIVNKTQLSDVVIEIPDFDTQKSIANLLESYDKLIESEQSKYNNLLKQKGEISNDLFARGGLREH